MAMSSVLTDIPETPATLARAMLISRRAADAGFDWAHLEDVRAKIAEELAELDQALLQSGNRSSPAVIEEFGDLLVALVNLSRRLNFDPDAALRAASAKFERRFRHMESAARSRGRALGSLSATEWDDLWNESKRALVAPA
jgi:ATP diphosphatase